MIDQPHRVWKQPCHLAAVGEIRQCTKVWPSKLVEMKKIFLIVKFVRKLKKWYYS